MSELVDDPEISDDEILYRRIAPSQIKYDESGSPYASGGAFRTKQMSVHLASRTSPTKVLENFPNHSLAAFTAGLARSLECIVASDKEDSTHALVCRKDDPSKSLTKSQAYQISEKARPLVVFRPPVE